jgi:hypothetical protein
MPLYEWLDENSDTKVEVLRSFAEYELPPTGEEIPEAIRGREYKWVRQIGKSIRVVRGGNWSGSKGNWLVLLSAVAAMVQHVSTWI